jgi:CheY-like chemotaxis protein
MPRRAVVVDDDPLSVELIASMLQEQGCETVTARNGNEALAALAEDPKIDFLISDIEMPGLSGTALAERASGFRPELRVLLLSGRENDAHGFPMLKKPFLESDLRRVMAQTTGLCD